MKKEIRKKTAYAQFGFTALGAAGLFAAICLLRGFFPFGDGSVMMIDLYSQYLPLLYRFYDVAGGQKNLFFEFAVYGGANLYADTVNEVINPLNYILFLFGRDMLWQAVNAVLGLYLVCSSVSLNFFLLKVWPEKKSWNTVLSLCYGFSGYAAYNFQIIKWMYLPVLFPLFGLALLRLLREKKGGWYAVLLAYQIALSVQMGFMTLLFTLFAGSIYFAVCREKKNAQEGMCRLGLYTAAALLLSGAVWLPTFYILISSSRAEENLSYLEVMRRHGLDDLFERLFQILHPVLLALGVFLAVGRMRENRKSGRGVHLGAAWRRLSAELRFWLALSAFLCLTVLLEPANLLWHLGSYVGFPVRYAYMVLFVFAGLLKTLLAEREDRFGVTEWEWRQDRSVQREEENLVRRGRRDAVPKAGRAARRAKSAGSPGFSLTAFLLCAGAALLCGAAFLLLHVWEERIVQAFSSLAISRICPTETLVVCGILFLLFGAALCALLTGKWAQAAVAAVWAVSGCCLFLCISWPEDYAVRLDDENNYREMTAVYEAGLQEEQAEPERAAGNAGDVSDVVRAEESGRVLWRVKETPRYPQNAGLVSGRASLAGYLPTADRGYRDAMKELGYPILWVSTGSLGGTPETDALLCNGDAPEGTEIRGFLTAEEPGEGEVGGYVPADAPLLVDERRGELRIRLTDAKAGQTLLIPFAAIDGWRCVRNGRAVKTQTVLSGFLGVPMEAGENDVVLRFTPPGLWAGMCLSILGELSLLAAAGTAFWRRKKGAAPGEARLPAAAVRTVSGLYRGILLTAWLGIYLVPAIGLAVHLVRKILQM